jgi:hypothetical protein
MLIERRPRECRSERGGVGCYECRPIRVFKAIFHQRQKRSCRARDRQRCLIDEVVEEWLERFGVYGPPLVCIGAPWSKTGIRFHPTIFEFFLADGNSVRWSPNSSQPIPGGRVAYGDPGALAKKPPWALELANGLRCLDAEGATFEIAGERASYGCEAPGSHRRQQEWVLGQPDRSAEPWVVSVLPTRVGRPQTSEVAVKVAWY